MSPDTNNSQAQPNDESEQYIMTFRNGALAKIRQLAQTLGVPDDNLEQVVEKGIKALELPDDNKLIYKKGEGTYVIDTRNL